MTDGFDPDAFIDAMSAAMALDIAPEHQPGVRLNMALLAERARFLTLFELPPETEPAPVYRP